VFSSYGHTFSGIYGYGELGGSFAGSQAEYVRVPIADVNTLKLPESVPDEKALFLSDVAVTSFHAAVDLGRVAKGDVVAIWGAGPIGLLTAKWCEIYGAKQIFVIDNVAERIALVHDHVRKAHTINFDEVGVNDELAKLCPQGVDVAIECAGFRYAKSKLHKLERALKLETDTADLVNECILATKLYGKVVLIADYVGYTNHFNIGALMEKHLYLSGGQCPVQACWGRVLQHIEKGDFDPTICVTHRGTLEDAPDFYSKMFYKQDGIVKAFLRP
jgi:threonine dehydrogenase-like Zn-dependent dehydrogenase